VNKLLIIFIFFFAISCKKIKKPIDQKSKINLVLDHWHQAAANADFDTYFSLMTKDAVFIGTDASENWNIAEFKTFCKPYFDKKETWNFKPLERHVFVDNNISWFDELLDTHMGICRGSGVLSKEDDNWKIKHYVLSITIPNDDVKQIVSLKKEIDSIFIKKLTQNNKK
jgi:ketosteroid isomerase-like protein